MSLITPSNMTVYSQETYLGSLENIIWAKRGSFSTVTFPTMLASSGLTMGPDLIYGILWFNPFQDLSTFMTLPAKGVDLTLLGILDSDLDVQAKIIDFSPTQVVQSETYQLVVDFIATSLKPWHTIL